jgi:hypothetical protein
MRKYSELSRRRTWRTLGPVTVVLLLLALGCGSSDETSSTNTPTSVPPTSTVPPVEPTATAAAPEATPEPTATTAPPGGARAAGEVEGVTFEVGEGSEATFTVREKLSRLPLPNDAVVRTTAVTGELHLDGRPSVFEIDLHKLGSDQARRDQYIRQTMFPSDPVAVFTVDDVGALPSGFTDGDTVTATVPGTLTLRGSDFPISFEVEARDDGEVIFIVGRTSFVWADLEIPPPNIGQFVQVEDEVKVEILLAAKPR